MHHFHSTSSIYRLRLAAVLWCVRCVLPLVTVGVLVRSILTDNRELAIIGIGLIALTVVVAVLQWLVAARAQCPLCRTPVLAANQCARHRRARTFLGGHRLPVALAVLSRNSFQCPYCLELTAVAVRSQSRQPVPLPELPATPLRRSGEPRS